MPKPNILIEDKKEVMKRYLKSSTVLPLMFISSVGESSGYYYRFLPELSEELLNYPMAIEPPPDLIASIEAKLQTFKFLNKPYSERKAPAEDLDESQIIKLWLSLWCKVFIAHDIKEHSYRLTQLLDILPLWQTKNSELKTAVYREIIKTCYELGSARLAVVFFDNVKSVEMRLRASVLCYYLDAISSGETAKPLHEDIRLCKENVFEGAKPVPKTIDYQTYFQACKEPFTQRTFLTEKMGNVISEEVKLGVLLEECKECNEEDDKIILDNVKVPQRFCSKCKKELHKKLKIRVGRPIIYAQGQSIFWEEKVKTMSIKEVEEAIEGISEVRNGHKILNFSSIRRKEEVFWNLIWHFSVHKLPYDLFLPYKITTRRSLVIENLKIAMKGGEKVNSNLDKDNTWYDQFKQVRAFALCTDNGTQTNL